MIDLLKLADALDKAKREGFSLSGKDEPEDVYWITMTDTLAREISKGLREYADYIAHQTILLEELEIQNRQRNKL